MLKKIYNLHNACLQMADDVRTIAEDLDHIQNGPFKNFRKHLEVTANKLLDLSSRIMVPAEKIEALGEKLLSTGMAKENLTAELAERFNKQGTKLEYIGKELETIGEKFQVICAKLRNIGKRLEWDSNPQLSNLVETLVDLGWQIKKSGGRVSEIGIEFENLKPTETEKDPDSKDDRAINKYLPQICSIFGDISRSLEGTIKVRKLN